MKIGGIGESYKLIEPAQTGKYLDLYEEGGEDLFKLGHEEYVSAILVRRKRDLKHFVCKKINLDTLDGTEIDPEEYK